jgi:hypothetical protein
MTQIQDFTALGFTAAALRTVDNVTTYEVAGFNLRLIVDNTNMDAQFAVAQTRQQLVTRLSEGRAFFRNNAANWPNMTAGQKDNANRLAQRAVSNLMAYVLNSLDAGD